MYIFAVVKTSSHMCQMHSLPSHLVLIWQVSALN